MILRRLLLAALIAWWVAMFIGTHLPKVPESLDLSRVSDKTLHYTAYVGLGTLLSAVVAVFRVWSWRAALGVWGTIAVYGIVDELLQIPVGRRADVRDWLADVIGGASGIGIFALIRLAAIRCCGSVKPP